MIKSKFISYVTVKDCNSEYHGKYRVCVKAQYEKVLYNK